MMKRLPLVDALRRCALAAALALPLLAAALPCAAATGDASSPAADAPRPLYETSSRVDWEARVLRVDVALDLAAAGLRLPDGRLSAERMVEHDLPALAKDAVFALQADSHRTVEDAVADGSLDSGAFVALAGMARLRELFPLERPAQIQGYLFSRPWRGRLALPFGSPADADTRAPRDRAYQGLYRHRRLRQGQPPRSRRSGRRHGTALPLPEDLRFGDGSRARQEPRRSRRAGRRSRRLRFRHRR